MAPICSTGYGVAAVNLLNALVKQGENISAFPIGRLEVEPQHEFAVQKSLENARSFDPNAPCLRIYHQFSMAESIGRGQRVGFPFFELDAFNPLEVHHLASLDHILVSCEWAKRVVQKYLPSARIDVVPLGVDMDVFNPRLVNTNKPDSYVFLNAGKWEVRKGHDFIADTFNAAFTPRDNVELWLMPSNSIIPPNEQADWQRRYLETPMGRAGRIKILPWLKSQAEVARVMAMADAGLFPSRAEGWNLELLEMMAMGRPVIATNYSAHTEFCNARNSHLITVDDTEPAQDGKWFRGQGSWAAIGHEQIEQCVGHMRHLFKVRPGNAEGEETGRKFSWEAAASKVVDALMGYSRGPMN